jgi:HPt (histidine-containing phosphotransfer) domain-containing protein
VSGLREAVTGGDLDEVHALAHSMKGASKQIGATQAGNLLGAIEAQKDLRDCRTLVDELDEEIPRVDSAIHALLRRSARAS